MHLEKQVSYTHTNSYSTLNEFSDDTKNIWMVCHGLAYLSPYFIKYFDHLDPATNYVVAPQAPSKYYQDKTFKYIGASWFTRKYLEQETVNIINYLNAIYDQEINPKRNQNNRLILLGYSQGVSAISRWLASRKINCDSLLFHSGGLPKELKTADFDFMKHSRTVLAYGNEDEYLKSERLEEELNHYKEVFGSELNVISFIGKHEVSREFIKREANFSYNR